MKKLISVFCVLAMVFGVIAVSSVGTAAAEPAKTALDVVKGDEVTYTLTLGGVEEPVIGCEFSIYYDKDLFDLVSVADFTNSTKEDDWQAMMNPTIDGQVLGNWSILSGIDFSEERNFLTMNLKATGDGTGHISYFIRYLYDNNIFNSEDRPQITEYKFTCTVLVNGEPVLEKAQPELNTVETQKSGLFVNSVTGDSADADADIPGTVVKKNNTNSNVTPGGSNNTPAADNNTPAADNNTPANNTPGNNSVTPANNNGTSSNAAAEDATPPATTAEGYYVVAVDDSGRVIATSDQAPVVSPNPGTDGNGGGTSPVLWIIIALVVLGGGGAAAYFYMKKKPAKTDDSPAAEDESSASDTEE